MANMESPTVFKGGSTYFWIMSDKSGWRANDNQYATAPAMTGPWTKQGLVAPAGERTWLSQSTCVLPIVGSTGTAYLFLGDHWFGPDFIPSDWKYSERFTYLWTELIPVLCFIAIGVLFWWMGRRVRAQAARAEAAAALGTAPPD